MKPFTLLGYVLVAASIDTLFRYWATAYPFLDVLAFTGVFCLGRLCGLVTADAGTVEGGRDAE